MRGNDFYCASSDIHKVGLRMCHQNRSINSEAIHCANRALDLAFFVVRIQCPGNLHDAHRPIPTIISATMQ